MQCKHMHASCSTVNKQRIHLQHASRASISSVLANHQLPPYTLQQEAPGLDMTLMNTQDAEHLCQRSLVTTSPVILQQYCCGAIPDVLEGKPRAGAQGMHAPHHTTTIACCSYSRRPCSHMPASLITAPLLAAARPAVQTRRKCSKAAVV